MSQTIEENVRFVHEWSLDRIQYLYSEDGGNCEKMLDAVAIHDEFAEWIAADPDELDQVSVLSMNSFS